MDQGLYFDWNSQQSGAFAALPFVELHDETLRDGIQSASVTDPPLDFKMSFLDVLEELGVHSVCLGLPGASARSYQDTDKLAEHAVRSGHKASLAAAARTHIKDIEPIVEISQRHGRPIEAMMFLGSSSIRQRVENWDMELLLKRTRTASRFATDNGIPAGFVTEDTTRSDPATLAQLFRASVDEGVERLVLCDTVGHATPDGVVNLVRWTKQRLVEWGVQDRVKIDWHGHDDRGLALINALYAAAAGADRVHGTVLGIGERVGNTPLDLMIVNLRMMQDDERKSEALSKLTSMVSAATNIPVPIDYPVFGRDAFRTATGVHAAAIIKAEREGEELADLIYSSVVAHHYGREQIIEVGHMSGKSNVRYWCEHRGIEVTEDQVEAVFRAAKRCSSLLSEREIREVLRDAAQES